MCWVRTLYGTSYRVFCCSGISCFWFVMGITASVGGLLRLVLLKRLHPDTSLRLSSAILSTIKSLLVGTGGDNFDSACS